MEHAAGYKSRRDDAHAFLRVVRAVAQAEKRRREELQPAEPAVDLEGTLAADDPARERGQHDRKKHSDDRRKENKENRFHPSGKYEGFEAGVGNRRSAVSTDQRVRRTGGKAEDQGNQVPGDRSEQPGEDDLLSDEVQADKAFTDCTGHGSAKKERGDKIPKGGPSDGAKRRKDARGDDGGDGIGDVIALIHGGFDDFVDLFPLDDLNRIGFFVEELRDQCSANAVAFVFVTV